MTTHINNYKYRLTSDRECCYFQAIRIGECLGTTIDSNGFPQVEELWNKVWNFVNKRREYEKWNKILIDLLSKSEQKDIVKTLE